MKCKYFLFIVLSTIIQTSAAVALTCKNDYAGASGCANNTTAAGDCATLGFSKDNSSNCGHYLYCPFDTSYKKCVKEKEIATWSCPAGYSDEITSVSDCGVQGSNGWTYSSTSVQATDGSTVTCGKCSQKSCSGNAKYASVSDCGPSGSGGWNFSYCYYGDELRGTCTAKSCADRNFVSSSSSCPYVWTQVVISSGEQTAVCYECGNCTGQGVVSACMEKFENMPCTWACNNYLERPDGYPGGSCSTQKGNWKCCSSSSSMPSGYTNEDLYVNIYEC